MPITESRSKSASPTSKVAVSDTFTGSRYIVRFKDDVANHREVASAMLQAQSGHLIHPYDRVFKGFNATLPNEEAVEAIRKNPNVEYVVPDGTMTVNTAESPANWGLDRIDQHYSLNNTFNYFQTGSGVNLYIIDSGVDSTHSEFSGRMGNSPFTSVAPYNAYQDCLGHGTAVASVAAGTDVGVAKSATINPLQVVNCTTEKASDGDIVYAIDWVIQIGSLPGVINLSLGRPVVWYSSQPVDDAVRSAVDAGYHVVISAGNSDDDACDYTPARVAEAVTVGASGSSDSRPSWSNYGSCVDLFAPGVGVNLRAASQPLTGPHFRRPMSRARSR